MVDGNAVPCAEHARGRNLQVDFTDFAADETCASTPRFGHSRPSGVSPAVGAPGKVTYDSYVESILRLARLASPLLIHGESGTGKTTIARMIHQQSGERGQLVIVNCSTQADELASAAWFEQIIQSAKGGTLLLDEVSELPDETQRRLLAMLLAGEQQTAAAPAASNSRTRIIGTTAVNLSALVGERQVRKELFYRLSALSLQLFPLRERPELICDYARDILNGIAERQGLADRGISPEALSLLSAHNWPGNIRELENVCQSAAALGQAAVIAPHDIRLPVHPRQMPPTANCRLAGRTLSEIERQAVIETLVACAGNKALTARTLGISEKSIYNKIRRHKIQLNPAQ